MYDIRAHRDGRPSDQYRKGITEDIETRRWWCLIQHRTGASVPGMDHITRFLEENTARIRTDSSRRHYRIRLRQVEDKLGPLPDITGQELAGMLAGSTWSPGTIKTMKTVLSAYYRWAIRAGLVADPTVW